MIALTERAAAASPERNWTDGFPADAARRQVLVCHVLSAAARWLWVLSQKPASLALRWPGYDADLVFCPSTGRGRGPAWRWALVPRGQEPAAAAAAQRALVGYGPCLPAAPAGPRPSLRVDPRQLPLFDEARW